MSPIQFAKLVGMSLGIAAMISPAAAQAPLISSITPNTGPTQGGTAVTLVGTNFGSNPTVVHGGSVPTPSFKSNSIIIYPSPAGEGAARSVQVIASGLVSNVATFSYTPPSISAVSPTTAATSGGSTITLAGANFGINPIVLLNGSAPAITSKSHSLILFTMPAGQGTNLPISVIAGGQTSPAASISYTSPAITSISPANGTTAGGTRITIHGSNFGISPVVHLNGADLTPVSASHNLLLVDSPPGEGVAKPLTVEVGGQVSNEFLFSYDPPQVASVSPASAPTAGGSVITLTGSNFGLAPSVSLGGASVGDLLGSSHNLITFTAPPGQGTNLPLIVTASGQSSPPVSFSYGAPAITSISPANGTTAGGTRITIHGSNFGLSPVVHLNGADLTPVSASHNLLLVDSPPGEGIAIPLTVEVGGQVSNEFLFSYDPPQVASVSPSSAPTAGGSVITLTGLNFGLAPSVSLGGTSVGDLLGSSHNLITFTAPPGQGTNLPLVVTAAGQSSPPVSFSYGAPAITSISPANGTTAGGTRITIHGSNFGLSPVVHLNGADLTPVSASHNLLLVDTPPGEGVAKTLTVEVGGQVSNEFLFSYDPPQVASVSPASAPTAGGSVITLTGSNFGLAPSVSLGGTSVGDLLGSSHNLITFTAPPGQGTNLPLVVTAAGQSSPPVSFSYGAPAITSISPANGTTAGGTRITIHGSNFGLSPVVRLNGADLTPVSASHNLLLVDTPPGEGVAKPLTVEVGGQVSNEFLFSYDPPQVASVSRPVLRPPAGR
ncbi:MAG: IPT/TIG domain-containing protein [Akkermansiaceae bacterium]|nr:IPT/TIG domain-containing protein [Akkermansiaceae bacterium]